MELNNKIDVFIEESKREDIELNKKIDTLQDGVLSIQGQDFKYECQKYLDRKEPIKLLEYEQLMSMHNIYNKLGGNHDGDAMFDLVTAKFRKQQENM